MSDRRSSSGRRPSLERAATDELIKPAWAAFLAASEVLDAVSSYQALRHACNVPADAFGRPAFDAVLQATTVSAVPHKTKSLISALAENWKLRPVAHDATRVVISGAGPTGLRAAVEAALMGMRVHVLEKRTEFSRVNILMLWQPTADDLIAYGARTFYPKFTNRNIGSSPLHLGTREIQLVLLKNALLLGVTFAYGAELVAVQAPPPGEAGWVAWARAAAGPTSQTANDVLAFKPNKTAEYTTGAGQGKCNQLQTSALDHSFARAAGEAPPAGVDTVRFDALLLAEGEWSPTCRRLGVTKSVDRFSQAIGLVINMRIDPLEPLTKDPNMRSFTVKPFEEKGRALAAAGVAFEFAEYLKGETHYIVLTIKKAALLRHGALRRDEPRAEQLLTRANLDEAALLRLARLVATTLGLPESTQFCARPRDFHPAKLFDFSTRARCVAPFRALGVRGGGAAAGAVAAADVEAQPYLRAEEGKWLERSVAMAVEAVEALDRERAELEAAIKELSSTVEGGLNRAADEMVAFASLRASSAPPPALSARRSSGVQDDEWGDDDDYGAPPPPPAERPSAAQARREEYGVSAAAEAARQEEEAAVRAAQLEAYQRAVRELEIKAEVQRGQAAAARERRAEWAARVAAHAERALEQRAPVFPLGDSLLEPFWPQGLGSNRGFHSALDAVWAVHVMQSEGLEAALLERSFWYDVMLQGPWVAQLLKPASGWSADPMTRYADGAVLRTKRNYTNPQSRRNFRGEGATPARIRALDLRAEPGLRDVFK